MRSVILKTKLKKKNPKTTLDLVHMSKSSLNSTLRCTLPKKKSALTAKHTVKQHVGMGGNWFSNQLRVSSLVFASETKILGTVIYCRGHSLVF